MSTSVLPRRTRPSRSAPASAGPSAPAVAQWSVWTTTARLVVIDPAVLPAARALVEEQLAAVDAAASRFRSDSDET